MYFLNIAICCVLVAVLNIIVKFLNARFTVKKLRDAGLPMLKFRFSTGHLGAIRDLSKSLPSDATMHTLMRQASKRFTGGIFYANLWPFSGTWVVVTSSAAAAQIQSLQLPKPEILRGPLDTITGGPSLITMAGEGWKTWRNLFNPGFSPSYLMQLAPKVIDEVEVFCSMLRGRANRGEIIQLEDLTLKLTVDIIASVALDTRLQCQTQPSLLASALQRQIEWTSFGTALNPFRRYFTIRPLVLWYNSRLMNRFIAAEIDSRYAEHLASEKASSDLQSDHNAKSVMSLVLKQYLADMKRPGKQEDPDSFKKVAIPQLRLFLFAGRDTTSSTLLYCYYLLGTHPEVLARLREEHDSVLGTQTDAAADVVRESPQKLNQLSYTTAVIKEALRLFPPSASLREGRPGVELIDDNGQRFPTAGCYVWSLTVGLHHNQRAWKDADDFRPDRWLATSDSALYPDKNAWRAFEYGPRNCIGQTLAMLELRIVLIMTARQFDIKPAYEEWDVAHPSPGIKMVNGIRAYQAEKGGGGAHPADGLPCKVLLRG